MILLTNEWTNAVTGHAREELNWAAKLLNEVGEKALILSVSEDYGDKVINPKRSLFWEVLPKRGPFFRLDKRVQLNNFGKEINDVTRKDKTTEAVIFTSQHGKSTAKILSNLKFNPVKIRLLSIPETKLDKSEFKSVVTKRRLRNESMSVETTAQQSWCERELGINVDVVPPISGLTGQTLNKKRNKVGIFWPTAHPESLLSITNLIGALEDCELYVRLPRSVDKEQISKMRFREIPHDLSGEEFIKVCESIKVAILPHRNYQARGSSLASMFTGMGSQVIARAENSFFIDLLPFKLMTDLQPDSLRQKVDVMLKKEQGRDDDYARLYREYLKKAWLRFLSDGYEK